VSDASEHAVFDHAVYAGADLDALVLEIEARTGVRPVPGGEHESLRTHNALLGLGAGRYLELLAPIPGAGTPSAFGRLLSDLPDPRLFMWAVRVPDLDGFVRAGTRAGLAMGAISPMSRQPPTGPTRRWRLTTGGAGVYGGVVPFGIEWAPGAHPADDAPAGCTVAGLRADHPEPDRMRDALRALGVDLAIDAAATPALHLTLDAPAGRVALQ